MNFLKSYYSSVSTAFLSSFFVALILINAAQDNLLFNSDIKYIALLVLLFSTFISIFLCLILSMVCFFFKSSPARVYSNTCLSLFLSFLVIYSVDIYSSNAFYQIFLKLFGIKLEWLNLNNLLIYLALFIFLISFFLFILNLRKNLQVIHRIVALSRKFLVLFPLVVLLMFAESFFPISQSVKINYSQPKHMIFIVIDGFPAYMTNLYNPESKSTALDSLAKKGIVYMKAYTNKPYTSGFFGVLYSGKLDLDSTKRPHNMNSCDHLPFFFNQKNVSFKCIVFHRNGFPETNGINNYVGLRSIFLDERIANYLPNIMDYHVFLNSLDTRTDSRAKQVFTTFFQKDKYDDQSQWSFLYEQIKAQRKESPRSFTLFHIGTAEQTVQDLSSVEGAYANWAENDYHYSDDDTVHLQVKAKYQERIEFLAKKLRWFLEVLAKEGILEDTLVVFTADHGTTFEDGKVWYGYHADEEVIRVPFILFGGEAGYSTHPIDTQDIHDFIKSYFSDKETKSKKHYNAIHKDSKVVSILSLPSKKRKEYNLSIIDGALKIKFNLFDLSNVSKSRVEKFEEHYQSINISKLLKVQLDDAINNFGLESEIITDGL